MRRPPTDGLCGCFLLLRSMVRIYGVSMSKVRYNFIQRKTYFSAVVDPKWIDLLAPRVNEPFQVDGVALGNFVSVLLFLDVAGEDMQVRSSPCSARLYVV